MNEERSSGESDVEELRGELEQIKDAMGIRERYGSATAMWLLFGLAVPLAAALSQYVHLEQLPAWYHTVIWLAILGGGFGLFVLFGDWDHRHAWSSEGKPHLGLQFAIVYLATFPLQLIAVEYVAELSYTEESAMVLSIIVVLLGVAYGIFGSSLRAYYVRRRDRFVFYVGAGWMIVLGTAIPQVDLLEMWAYAAFGGLYFVYAMGAYVLLARGGSGD